MAHRHPPRLDPALYRGVRQYFLTICCERRLRTFEDATARELVVSQLRRTSESMQFAVLAYCLMPDHLHAVCEATSDACDLDAFVRLFKQQTAYAWKQATGQRLWQTSYFDHVLRDSESTQGVARYVLENPVRARLVEHPADYPHVGSFVYDRDQLIEWAFGWNGAEG